MCQGVMMLWLYQLYGRAVLIFLFLWADERPKYMAMVLSAIS